MSKILTVFTLGFQIALTFVTTFCIYMIFAFCDSDFGLDGLLGLFIFQPIFAVIISGLTILICLIVGLPIRLNKKINNWWTTNFFISIIGAILGLIFLLLAMWPAFHETITYSVEGLTTSKQIPNLIFSITGLFLISFSILHIYPPRKLSEKIKSYLPF